MLRVTSAALAFKVVVVAVFLVSSIELGPVTTKCRAVEQRAISDGRAGIVMRLR